MAKRPEGVPLFVVTADMIATAAFLAGERILEKRYVGKGPIKLYGIPRGGVCAAYAILAYGASGMFQITDSPAAADVIVDDLVDSGATFSEYHDMFPGKPFAVLFDKSQPMHRWLTGKHLLPDTGWLLFPWEHDDGE